MILLAYASPSTSFDSIPRAKAEGVTILDTGMMPTTTCDPTLWAYESSGAPYAVKILSANAQPNTAMPGDTVTISGSVELQQTDYYVNQCGDTSTQTSTGDPSLVTVSIESGGSSAASSGGAFSLTVQIPADATGASYEVSIVATASGASDSTTVDISLQTYSPKISVTGSGTYYPGDTIVFAGAGWAPTGPVTVQFSGSQQVANGPTFTGEFTIPQDAAEGPLSITANQAPNLQATTSVTIQWRPLTLTLTNQASSVQEGATITVTGTVTSNNGPVQGATVTATYDGQTGGTGTTGADGSFSVSMTLPTGNWAHYIYARNHGALVDPPTATISATATTDHGYKNPSNTDTYTAPIENPSGVPGVIADLATVPAAGTFGVGLVGTMVGITSAEAPSGAIYFGLAYATGSLALPVAGLVIGGAALIGLAYYRYRHPRPDTGPEYGGGVRG